MNILFVQIVTCFGITIFSTGVVCRINLHREVENMEADEGGDDGNRQPSGKPAKLLKTESQTMSALDQGDHEEDWSDEELDLPTTLEDFKYGFNEDGCLKHTETGEPFLYNYYTDPRHNQKRYEALGEIITEYVYDLLVTETKLKKVKLPVDATEDEPQSFIFMTDDALTNPDRLLVLIHGSGVVRAGQWARRLIINDCLGSGTQIPFIKRGVNEGYGVIVLNTNLNFVETDEKREFIRENESPEDHGIYVWDHIISEAKARHIAIVAHSYGGIVTTNLV